MNTMIAKKMVSSVRLKLSVMCYTTSSLSGWNLLNRFYKLIEQTTHNDPHPTLIVASHHFLDPYPLVNEVDLLCLSTMDLLIQFGYPSICGYSKFCILYTMKKGSGELITFTICPAIPLTYEDGKRIPFEEVCSHICNYMYKQVEIYDGFSVTRVTIRIFLDGDKKARSSLSAEERSRLHEEIIECGRKEVDPIKARKIQNRMRSYPPRIIPAEKVRCKELKAFIVADTETILHNDQHYPYAAGLLLVRPGEKLNPLMIESYFSEDYSLILSSFEDRSTKVLYDFVTRISMLVKKEHNTIYFHNFSRFDGILLLKHLACHHKYKLKALVRNHRLYEIAVYSGNKMLFRFRDSLNLLPGTLDSLAKNLCPELGSKGSIDYENQTISSLAIQKESLLDYMKQDILLLGGVMKKAQEIYYTQYNVDIEGKITVSSLALCIFRMKFYDKQNWPIHIPNQNEDMFIRRGYYGGHTDVYIPSGSDLYYYDVNSLYPFAMKENSMPGGKPVWHSNLVGKDLEDDSLFGFIQAYVECPKSIKKPFLPYRDRKDTLIFPTGEFIGVYFSEELKFAKQLGYTVIPLSGYLFQRMESPFKHFVSTLFESRLEAKKSGNDALSLVYKTVMNSLYGRFGINPISTITEVCNKKRYTELLRKTEFISSYVCNTDYYIVSYHSNTLAGTDYWKPPKNSAVQLSAAITAYARIYMYPFISREDSFYTDTDSVVLGHPLPELWVSSSELGKFKLEDRINKGLFLAPKCYMYTPIEGDNVIKYKGTAKSQIPREWFEEQYAEPSRTTQIEVTKRFSIDWSTLNILKKESTYNIGLNLGSKRDLIYHENIWVDTAPIVVNDLSSLNNAGKLIVFSLKDEVKKLKSENELIKDYLALYYPLPP